MMLCNWSFVREQKERERQQKLEQEREEKRRRQQEEEKKRKEEEEKRKKAEKEKADKEKAAKKVEENLEVVCFLIHRDCALLCWEFGCFSEVKKVGMLVKKLDLYFDWFCKQPWTK